MVTNNCMGAILTKMNVINRDQQDRQWHFVDAKLPSPACVPLGARGTNELGRTFPGGAGVRFFLLFLLLFFFLFLFFFI